MKCKISPETNFKNKRTGLTSNQTLGKNPLSCWMCNSFKVLKEYVGLLLFILYCRGFL